MFVGHCFRVVVAIWCEEGVQYHVRFADVWEDDSGWIVGAGIESRLW